MAHRICKTILCTVLIPVILLILVPALLYIPAIQDRAVSYAARLAYDATGMDISIGRLRLGFPLRLSIDSVNVIQAEGDTMLTARHADMNVNVLPLLRGQIDISSINLDKAFYQTGNADSLLWLRAHIAKGNISGTSIGLNDKSVNLGSADISGVSITLQMLTDTTAARADTNPSAPWLIQAEIITVSDVDCSISIDSLIDSLGCHIDRTSLRNATVDMKNKRIAGQSLNIDSAAVSYIYPHTADTASAESHTETESDISDTWTISVDTIRLTAHHALYAERGASPQHGFDPSYISVAGITVEIDSFYTHGTAVRVPLRKLSCTERCGLPLHANGLFLMDRNTMYASGFNISTRASMLRFDAMMGIGDMSGSLPLSVKGNGSISPSDIADAFPEMRTALAPFGLLTFSADAGGTTNSIDIRSIDMAMPDVFRIKGRGSITNPFDPAKVGGKISFDGALSSLSDKKYAFLPIPLTPSLRISGNVDYRPNGASGRMNITTHSGKIAADGSWTAIKESYEASISLDRFPTDMFMPSLGLGQISAHAAINGHGYNPTNQSTSIDASIDISQIEYLKETYRDISLRTTLHSGMASGALSSYNPGVDASMEFTARLDGDSIHYDLTGDIRDINLKTLHLSDSINSGRMHIASSGFYNITTQGMDIKADISSLLWRLPDAAIEPDAPISLTSVSESSGSRTTLSNGDMNLLLTTPGAIGSFISATSSAIAVIQSQIDSMRIDVDSLAKATPKFALRAEMGSANVASQYLESSGIKIDSLTASIANDSLLSFNSNIDGISVNATRIDSLRLYAVQHGRFIVYNAAIGNRPGTFDDFARITLNGFAGNNRASAFIKQENIHGEKGFNIGLNATVTDSIVTVKFMPFKPTIAYKPWTINTDNFLSFDLLTKHIDADLTLSGDDSYIRIFTAHSYDEDSISGDDSRHYAGSQEDLKVQISHIRIQDWLSINPFAPPVNGELSADMRFRYEKPVITGDGSISLADLYYGRDRVGDFDLDVNVANSPGGRLMADVALMVDSVRTVTAKGVLNDSTLASTISLDFRIIQFPLHVLNPFIPDKMATLSGQLNGAMTVTGDIASPIFNGDISFDTTDVKVAMLGSTFRLSDKHIPVDSNVVTFEDFSILGCNNNPLTVDGTVDARNISNVRLDLGMDARNIQIVKSDRARGGADLYGKAFLDLSAWIKGNMQRISIDTDISLLEGTNVTYILTDAEQAVTSKTDDDMVRFVQFNDSTASTSVDTIASTPMAVNIKANLHLREGATINVDLSSGGSNRLQILPSGDLDFTMSPLNGTRLTGRLNINSGFIRYTPPLMSEKNFTFNDGSFIAFNGDMMNPVLNISAVDVVRANVTQSGQDSRIVNFDVLLSVTNTMENMIVAFDLSTNDDITVQNELSSMSAEQRANQAMNLLLYNVYTGAGTKGTSLSGNPLFSFLTSQLNTWAANNIRGVDISFGIDQYDRTYEGSTSTATSYSYRVSKSLFNDRFKIVVGGNYSTDADSDENLSQNLINDISFEYMLNASGSMYVKVFRHTGYESILEGEITQTGVGFVLKKKLNTLWDLFGIKRD